MKETATTVQYSASQIEALHKRGDIGLDPDAPEAESLGEEFWSTARVVMPTGKTSVHLRIDRDVMDWFRGTGKGHLTRMHAVLRSFVEAQKRRPL